LEHIVVEYIVKTYCDIKICGFQYERQNNKSKYSFSF